MSSTLLADAVAAERRVDLQAEQRAEQRRAARQAATGPRDPYRVDGAALASTIRAALLSVPAARRASEHEQDALSQMVWERVCRRAPRGRPREVLRWIDRAERMPLWAERTERDRIERGAAGRNLIAGMVGSLLAQSREWRDTTDRYRTRAQAQADTGPMVDTSADPTALVGDHLGTAALADRQDPELAPLPEGSLALADAVRAAVVNDLGERKPGWHLSAAEARRVGVALLVDVGGAELSAVAASFGRTLNALAIDRTRGGATLRMAYPDPAALVALVRECAEREGLSGERTSDRPHLSAAEHAASTATDATARRVAGWTGAYLAGARSAYSPATARAARVRRVACPPHAPVVRFPARLA